jgi:hypothetical protein
MKEKVATAVMADNSTRQVTAVESLAQIQGRLRLRLLPGLPFPFLDPYVGSLATRVSEACKGEGATSTAIA